MGARPVSVLIAALGGQGGGVLTEWIVAAAGHAGHPSQATSIPGVAQRTGATTYYVEVAPEASLEGAPEPTFSLYPMAGDVDVVVAGELLEAGRTIEADYASPDRTTLVASTHRLFAIGEKSLAGNGVFPHERIVAAARALARTVVAVDALAIAREVGSEVNAVLLGALAATKALPMAPSDFEAAIAEGGVAVDRNLAGFRAGLARAFADATSSESPKAARPWAEVKRERATTLGSRAASFLALAERIEAEFPERLVPTLGEAAARLVDYQDTRYADSFLERVRRLRAVEPDDRLVEAFARRLAVWMSYEDVIRVADLKTRRGRFERIRQETGAGDDAVLVVTDYFKPDLDELYGILPAGVAAPIARWAERRWPGGRPAIGQHVRTTSVLGFLRVWTLGRLRVMRPSSLRYRREWALIERWQQAVLDAAALDTGLAVEVARTADVVKGYGDVRRRLSAAFAEFVDQRWPGIVAAGRADGYARAARLVQDARERMLAEDHNDAAVMPPAAPRVPVAAAPPGVRA